MAKRLSKALRGKRRWVGVECSDQFSSRSSLEKYLRSVLASIQVSEQIRVMDFHANGSDVSRKACEQLELAEQRGFAILEVPHTAYEEVRRCFASEESFNLHGILSRTSSGKIRLVRERLNIPRPIRKR